MTRLALAAILAATSAQAGPVNLTNANIEGDKAELHMESTAMGVLTYSNTAEQRSANGTWEVYSDEVLCLLTIVAKGRRAGDRKRAMRGRLDRGTGKRRRA